MGGFSALCLFEAGAITAVSGPYLYTDREQAHPDTSGLCACFYLCIFLCAAKKEGACILCDSGGRCVCLCTMHSKNKLL